jgi:hypothetical protein
MGAENLCHQAILMDHASGAVAALGAEVVQVGDAIWQRAERRGLVQGVGFRNPAARCWSGLLCSPTRALPSDDLIRPVRTLSLLNVTRTGSAERVAPGASPTGITNRICSRYRAQLPLSHDLNTRDLYH